MSHRIQILAEDYQLSIFELYNTALIPLRIKHNLELTNVLIYLRKADGCYIEVDKMIKIKRRSEDRLQSLLPFSSEMGWAL